MKRLLAGALVLSLLMPILVNSSHATQQNNQRTEATNTKVASSPTASYTSRVAKLAKKYMTENCVLLPKGFSKYKFTLYKYRGNEVVTPTFIFRVSNKLMIQVYPSFGMGPYIGPGDRATWKSWGCDYEIRWD